MAAGVHSRLLALVPGQEILRLWYYRCLYHGYTKTISHILKNPSERRELLASILCDLNLNDAKVKLFGIKFKVNLHDKYIGRVIYKEHIWEPHITQIIRKIVTPGMVFLDIGANIGYYTTLASTLVGAQGRVIAFEPDSLAIEYLRANCFENKLTNVHVENVALGHATESAYLQRNNHNWGDNRICEKNFNAGKLMPIEIVQGDHILEKLGITHVDVIKLDVQGYEPKVIKGLEATLSHSPDCVIITEFWPWGIRKYGEEPKDFFDELISNRREAFVITRSGPIHVDSYASLQQFIPPFDSNQPDSSFVDLIFCKSHVLM